MLWTDAPVIHRYTRAQALADGVLVDVTETAREAGFRVPVAVTAAWWANVSQPSRYQDTAGRLWDVLWLAAQAARRSDGSGALTFPVRLRVNGRNRYQVTMHSGPGDDGEHVITLMRSGED